MGKSWRCKGKGGDYPKRNRGEMRYRDSEGYEIRPSWEYEEYEEEHYEIKERKRGKRW